MSPIRGHLLLLGLTATLCAGSFVLDFLYVRRGDKGGEYSGRPAHRDPCVPA